MILTNPNILVEGFGVAAAQLFKEETVVYYAVGEGDEHWDIEIDKGLSKKDKTRTTLFNELFRKKIDNILSMDYIDENNDISEAPTNRLQLRVTLSADEAVGSLREFGLFVSLSGVDIPNINEGILILHEIHEVRIKGADEKQRYVNLIIGN